MPEQMSKVDLLRTQKSLEAGGFGNYLLWVVKAGIIIFELLIAANRDFEDLFVAEYIALVVAMLKKPLQFFLITFQRRHPTLEWKRWEAIFLRHFITLSLTPIEVIQLLQVFHYAKRVQSNVSMGTIPWGGPAGEECLGKIPGSPFPQMGLAFQPLRRRRVLV